MCWYVSADDDWLKTGSGDCAGPPDQAGIALGLGCTSTRKYMFAM